MKKMYKITLMGDNKVGKTSIRLRYLGDGFTFSTIATLGTEFSIKRLGANIVQIWDLAGQNDYSFLRRAYYIGAHGAILVFDLSNPGSFHNLPKWMDEIYEHLHEYIPMVLVGNKADLLETATSIVADEEVNDYLCLLREQTGLKLPYFKSSARTDLNIDELFDAMLAEIEN